MQQATYCDDYPVKNYTMVVSTQSVQLEQKVVMSSEGKASIETFNSLPDNVILTFKIIASNDFGTSETTLMNFCKLNKYLVEMAW